MKKTWKKIPILFLSLCMLCASFPLIIQSVQAQEQIMITSEPESKEIQIVSLYSQITVQSGQLMPDTCEIVENDIYGYIVDYSLKKGHTLSVSGDDYVFSVRAYQDGNYNTMLKSATSASFTATEDVTVGMLIRKTDKSALTEQDFAAITIYDSQYGMIDVEGYAHRFTVEAETIEGNTVTTRANIFLPESYSEDGDATPLIIMTNGYSAHLTDSTWNGNTAENIGVVKTYLEAGYAVLVVNNTANHTSQTPDLGCPQLVDSYLKAHAYVTENLNVEENFSIHARSFGTFAGVRLMREVPELIKCAVMTGSRVSFAYEWRGLDKAFIANRFGFEDATGTTYEANKLIGYDPYADVDAEEYQLPPTFWMLAEGDATERPLTYIGKLKEHGNDVLQKTYAEISHTGICTLNSEQSAADALAFLEKYQSIEGKTISILGDSISTYAGVSNDSTINATLAGGAIYYTPGKQDIYREDTWWQQTIDALGMELLVNNSWSGSCVFPTRSGTAGAYVNRCVQLHNDKTGQEPDVIAVFLGTNDFSYYQSALGSFDAIDFDTLIVQNEDGTYTYATPTTSCEAYAIMLHKMTVRYPDAEVYCLGMLARRGTAAQPTAFNASLKQIATLFGCTYVELESLISTDPAEFDKYLTDARVHPGPLGMDLMTKALASEMLGRDVALNNVSYQLLNVSADRRITTVLENDALCIKLTEGAGCENLHVNVQMDGVDVTDQYYANGVVSIPCVSGDVVIIATADRQLSHFGWKFDGEELIPFTEQENALTRKSGNTTNGALMNTYYQLQTPILLNSDQPWTVAWKASGNIWSGMMLSENATSNANGNRYMFKTNGTNGFIGFGESVSGTYHNYGIALNALGVDVTAEHVYRLENRIAADGSNMVYLYVDGTCMGAMNNYFIGGSSDQKQTVDWLNGKDFTFAYIGTSGHALNNCKLEYFTVWEAGHTHVYTTVTTAPTCAQQGYTTHTCVCGDSYVDSYVEAIGHTWSGGTCTECSAEHPNAVNYEGKVISILSASTSTFAGYIPEADGFNLAHRPRYPQDNLLTDVNETWWMQVIAELNAKLGINDSWADSQVLNTQDKNSGDLGPDAAMASVTRIKNLGANGTPDVILFFGAGNDMGRGVPAGSFDPATAPTEVDLTATKWDTLADAYVAAIMRLQYFYPDAKIVAMTTYAMPSYVTNAKLDKYGPMLEAICAHYGVEYLSLRDCGVTFDMLPDNIHPNAEGMDHITDAVVKKLLSDVEIEAGEHDVHKVTHDLTQATASLGYYKGISAGESFEETLAGEDLTVRVTMGGVDITNSCYKDGRIYIENVTGDLTITVKGKFTVDGHLQELPESFCSQTNLWQVLEPENIYYTVNGWGNTADGNSWSITFPVKAGDRIWATSLGKYPDNGSTANGVRVTWFDENGVLQSLSRDKVYAEFAKYGYITAPAGAVALNLPMTGNQEHYAVYILSAQHNYTSAITAPTCTELGYTTYTCVCGDSYVDSYVDATGHSYQSGACTICGDTLTSKTLTLRYDDRYDVSGKDLEIVDAGTPTSYKVGYGVANGTLDDSVIALVNGKLIAVGIGTAKVRIDDTLYEIAVTPAPISLILLAGQSNMRGSEGNANQSIVCPDGMVYATYGDDRGADNTAMTLENATMFAPSALAGEYSNINVNGTTDCLSGYPVYSLTDAGAGKIGPDSGFAYEWVKQTGEKVWIVNAAHGGTSISVWQPGTTEYEQCQALFTACQQTLQAEIAAGHYTLSHMGYFWCQGCSDRSQSAAWYVQKYLAMHEGFKTELAFDHDSNPETTDKTFEFGGIIPVRVGSTAKSYRDGTYSVANPYAYHESFVDLRMSGPRVAQYWMGNNPELTDIFVVCTIGENWVWMPDGTNGVSDYFNAHYANGTVDYTTQVAQSASWYTPTTPKAVHDSIHYNQIGYNEIGRESVRNMLYILGIKQAPETETTVKFVGWDGFTEFDLVSASKTGASGTLVVPMVSPVWAAKDMTFTLSEGLSWNYYDLLAESFKTEGSLQADGYEATINVVKGDPYAYFMDHLQQLPDPLCAKTDLWKVLEHDPQYYASGTKWGVYGSGATVPSITIPVKPGDKIFATSFGKAGENGHTSSSGIRVTFFGEYEVVKTMNPAGTYAEFSANGGYLIAPEGAVAINIPMWNDEDSNQVFVLSAGDCQYTAAITAPTCAQQGYTTHTCACGDSYVDSYVEAIGHTWSGGTCTECSAEHPNAVNYEGKVISILGDSISTFAGYIPVADGFNLEHLPRYPQDNLLTDVHETWWLQIVEQLDAKLGINDSWRGATVSGAAPVTTGTTGENAAMHNLTRIQNLGSNGTPDVILFYGGTNDLAHVSKVGTFDAQTAPTSVDLTTKKWDNLAEGYVHTLLRLKYYYPDAQIVCLLPTYTTSYYSNTKLAEANAVLSLICDHYQVPYVDLRDCGITTADLPDGIHPDAQGMDYITQAVIDLLMDTCCVEQGENVVHSVKHTLTDAKSSASYYKGISHGKSFTTNITGKNVTVQVTMDSEDITASCYSNGTVNIPTVTGDVMIVATGEKQLIYAEYLQQLPEQYCENTNLWQILAHDKEYYSASGWTVHSSGNVYSVTLPVVPGDQLWATSMGGAGKNGSNINGIRVTWFDANGVLQSMPADQVYAEFSANGYLTAPSGAVAVNIPMWMVSDANELYILTAEHDYTASVTLPTGREKGYVTYNCTSCDDYYSVDWLPDDTYEGMTLVCVGDSITAGIGASAKGETDYVTLLSQALGMEYINLGASGTTLCTGGHRTCNIGQLTESKLRDADIVLIMMGINDYDQAKAGYYALGDIDSTDSSTIYGAARMWCERIAELKQTEQYKDTQFYFVTPCITSWNDSVTSQRNWDQSKTTIHGYTLRDLCNAIIDVAALYEISTIDMNLLSGMYYVDAEHNNVAEFGGDGVHFGDRGHEMVSEAFVKFLLQKDLNTDHDHTFGEWIITVYPTCRIGKESRVCTACGYAESRELDVKHDYDAIVTAPTCTEQGYTTYTCVCGDSYVDSYVDIIWHTYADGTCSNCGCDMIRVTLDDIIRYQGGVDSETGKINITFTNNWYTNISIPQNAEQVRVLTFKTYGAWGSAFLNDAGTFISGHCDKTVGGEWITLDVPADATVFRYGYLYDQIAQNNGFPTFEYLEFAGTDLQEAEQSPYMPRPETGCHAFSVDVNIAPAKGDPDGYEKGTDYGYIQLPANYDPYGEPVRLIIVCHGAGAELATYQSDAWKNTNYSFWTDLGYAVMDMYACPPELSKDNSALHYGNPVVLECYKAGYQYVMKHFNLKQDGIYLVGSSMGGLSSFQIAQSEEFPVIAQVAYCPVIDLFKQAYCNPWTTPSYQRSRIAQYFGFTGTAPTYTNSKHPSAQEIAYFEQNLDKTLRYSPILSNVLLGDPTTIFEVIPNSATATDAQEQAIYDKLTATHPNPLMIFHNLDDTTVSYRYSKYFVDMLKRSGQDAMLYTFETGGHNAWANGESYEVQGITRTITIKESQYQAYLFFSRFEQHEEHCEWVDPAIEPTCTQSGKTQGSHCAVCGEVLIAQQQVDALGHDMDESGSCSVCGYHEYIVGDVNNDEIVNRQDAIYLLYHVLLGNKRYPVNQPVDFNGDGNITRADAIYLLYHVLLPSKYPLS